MGGDRELDLVDKAAPDRSLAHPPRGRPPHSSPTWSPPSAAKTFARPTIRNAATSAIPSRTSHRSRGRSASTCRSRSSRSGSAVTDDGYLVLRITKRRRTSRLARRDHGVGAVTGRCAKLHEQLRALRQLGAERDREDIRGGIAGRMRHVISPDSRSHHPDVKLPIEIGRTARLDPRYRKPAADLRTSRRARRRWR